MQKINFVDLPSTTTPLNATNMNAIQTNVEDVFNGTVPAGNMVVDSIRSKNRFNKNAYVGYLNINSSGEYISESLSTNGVNYANVEVGKTYTLSSNINRQWVYNFSANIPTLNGSGSSRVVTTGTSITFTIPSGYSYVCVRSLPSNNEDNLTQNIQLELGSNATSYIPYQNLKSEDKYSVEEQEIGTWKDGKKLYRRCFTIPQTTISSSSTTVVSFSTGNINVVRFDGYIYVGTSQYRYPISGFRTYDYGIRDTGTGVQLLVGTSMSAEGTISGALILDYTK